eukprot:scaffold952_cov409-Prasinococcus_capsulatus_cf.AAC.53
MVTKGSDIRSCMLTSRRRSSLWLSLTYPCSLATLQRPPSFTVATRIRDAVVINVAVKHSLVAYAYETSSPRLRDQHSWRRQGCSRREEG